MLARSVTLAMALYLLPLAASVAAPGVQFSFQGFQVGMPEEEASQLRPDVPWIEEDVLEALRLRATVKLFRGVHLGKDAAVRIQLDPSEKWVASIGFTFVAATPAQCATHANESLSELKRVHGSSAKALMLSPAKSFAWTTSSGVEVFFLEKCSVGGREHYVSYSK